MTSQYLSSSYHNDYHHDHISYCTVAIISHPHVASCRIDDDTAALATTIMIIMIEQHCTGNIAWTCLLLLPYSIVLNLLVVKTKQPM